MRFLKFFLYVFLCISCTGNTIYEKPEDLITKDTMILLLTDMHIASASKYTKNKVNEKGINYMSLVYQKYKIDSIRFERSNVYYISKIDEYDKLLNRVKTKLKKISKKIQREINKSDSLEKKKESRKAL